MANISHGPSLSESRRQASRGSGSAVSVENLINMLRTAKTLADAAAELMSDNDMGTVDQQRDVERASLNLDKAIGHFKI